MSATRVLRAYLANIPAWQHDPTPKQLEREAWIIAVAQIILVKAGWSALTMKNLATALRMSPTTVRWHFVDTESILATILDRHLNAVAAAMAAIPPDTPNRQAACRGAYLKATRTPSGAHTEPHMLLLRDRCFLPPDLAEPIDKRRTELGTLMAGPHAQSAFILFDSPALTPGQMEAMLAARMAAEDDPPEAAPTRPARRPGGSPRHPGRTVHAPSR
jgi:AcrR family transcriptional regulator